MGILDDYKKKVTIKGNTNRDGFIQYSSEQFLETYQNTPEYNQIKIGTIENADSLLYDCLIYSLNSYKNNIREKTIIFSPNTDINIVYKGQYIRPINSNDIYIMESIDNQYTNKLKGKITECNFNLEYINDVGKNISIPCVLESNSNGVNGVSDGKYVTIGKNERLIIIQNNIETLKIKRDMEFKIDGLIYEVTGVDTATNQGVIYINLAEYQEGITEEKVYTLDIQEENISFISGESKQLNIIIKEDDVLIDKPVIFESNDTNIATVDENGLVLGISNGQCIITAKLRDNTNIFDTVNVEITDNVIENIEYRFDADNKHELTEYDTNSYSFYKYINDVKDITEFTFEIDYNGNNSNIVSIESIDGNNCDIVANSNSIYGTIFLVAKELGIEKERFEINIVSLWG